MGGMLGPYSMHKFAGLPIHCHAAICVGIRCTLSPPPPPPPPLTYSCDCPPFKTKLLKHSLLFLPFLHSVVLYYTCTLTLCVSSTVHSPAGYILHKKRNQIIILSHPCLLKLVYTSLLLIVDTKLLALKSYSNYYITSTRECLLTQPMYGLLY